MRRLFAFVLGCLAMVSMTSAAWATPIKPDEVVDRLKFSSVYVAGDAPNTDAETAGKLEAQLKNGDRIFIVMLGPDALDGYDGDIRDFAGKIDFLSGGDHVIGLSVGDQVIGYSLILPTGQTTELMEKAQSVATNTQEALYTFITNVHDWQHSHPQAAASQKPKSKQDDGGSVLVPILIGLGIFAAAVFVIWLIYNIFSKNEEIEHLRDERTWYDIQEDYRRRH